VRGKHSSPGIGLLDTLDTMATTSGSPDDDIANLCSGKFPDTFPGTISRMKPPPTFSQESDSTSSSNDNEDDSQLPSSCTQDGFSRNPSCAGDYPEQNSSSKEHADSSGTGGVAKLDGSGLSGGGVTKKEQGGVEGGEIDNAVWRWAQRHQPTSSGSPPFTDGRS